MECKLYFLISTRIMVAGVLVTGAVKNSEIFLGKGSGYFKGLNVNKRALMCSSV